MPQYIYKAIKNNGQKISGTVNAENQADLIAILRKSEYHLVSCKIVDNRKSSFSLPFLDKVKLKDLVTTFVHLEQLDRAGISIIDSIQDLKESSDSPKIKSLMSEIYDSIKNGNLLSESLAMYPEVFNSVYVGLVATGEKTGNFSESFNNIVDDLKWNIDMKRKTRKATVGPSFGILLMFLVMGLMTSIVVPKVSAFLLAQDIELPAITLSLIAFSNFMQKYWFLILMSIPAFWLLQKILGKFDEIAIKIDHFKLKIPVIGSIMNKIDAAKFCQFFAMTFRSGLGVIECLDASSRVIKNKAIKNSIAIVKQQVSDGQSLTNSIAATGYFPSLVIRMFKIGEESGNMESALKNIKFFYDREINDSIDKLVSMIQPTLTLVMGGMIAWITIAVFGPVYATFSKLG